MITLNHKNGNKEVLGTTSASNIELDVPSLVPEGKDKISVAEAFTYIKSDQDELKSNIKWLYQNGGVGSGGGGGSTVQQAQFEIVTSGVTDVGSAKYLYISTNAVNLRYKVPFPKNNIIFNHNSI